MATNSTPRISTTNDITAVDSYCTDIAGNAMDNTAMARTAFQHREILWCRERERERQIEREIERDTQIDIKTDRESDKNTQRRKQNEAMFSSRE